MRVPQKACVEYQIRFPRQARGKGKGNEPEIETRLALHRAARPKMPLDEPSQSDRSQLGSIHDEIGCLFQLGGEPLLGRDSVRHSPQRGQRMAPAGFRIPAKEGGLVRPGIDELGPQPAGPQPADHVEHGACVEAAGAHVHAYGQRPLAAAYEAVEESQGGIIDGLVAEILERSENRGFARPGEAGDEHQASAAGRGLAAAAHGEGAAHREKAPTRWLARPSAQSSAKATRAAADGAAASTTTSGRSSA